MVRLLFYGGFSSFFAYVVVHAFSTSPHTPAIDGMHGFCPRDVGNINSISAVELRSVTAKHHRGSVTCHTLERRLHESFRHPSTTEEHRLPDVGASQSACSVTVYVPRPSIMAFPVPCTDI